MNNRVIIDTDPGIDDALALLLALKSPELDIAAITTVSGNVPIDIATLNVFRIFSLFPFIEKPPVAKGASTPIKNDPQFGTLIHGEDGLGNLDRFHNQDETPRYPIPEMDLSDRNAADEILYQLTPADDPLSIITLGPLTNIARAIEKDKDRMSAVREIILMGGAVNVPGNVTSVAEFNIYYDPHAADIVFNAGIPLTVVGLDVTRPTKLFRDNVTETIFPNKSIISRFICDCTESIFKFLESRVGEASLSLHDPLAVGVAIDPSLVAKAAISIDIETEGKWTQGMMVADKRNLKPEYRKPPNADVCLAVESDRFVTFFLERILS